MSGYRMLFEDLKVGRKFEQGGNIWIKKSTRTASIIYPAEYSGRWFYFKNHDLVTIGSVWWSSSKSGGTLRKIKF